MAKLTAKDRAALKPSQFGLPDKARTEKARKQPGNYPMPDEGHAISAVRLAKKHRKAGKLSTWTTTGSAARPTRSSRRSDVVVADVTRFVEGYDRDFERALGEIDAGRKRSHWMWYLFPQIHGLFTQGWFKCHPLKEESGGFEGLIDGVKLLRQGKVKGQKLVYQTADRKVVVEDVPKAEAAMDAHVLAPTVGVTA